MRRLSRLTILALIFSTYVSQVETARATVSYSSRPDDCEAVVQRSGRGLPRLSKPTDLEPQHNERSGRGLAPGTMIKHQNRPSRKAGASQLPDLSMAAGASPLPDLHCAEVSFGYEASTNATPDSVIDGFEFLRTIGKGLISEFDKAWRFSNDGTSGRESVVLIFRMEDGSFIGRSQGFTNEYGKFTFVWNPSALAIVHTHPNRSDPKPGAQDKRVADKYRIPNFTITNSGMYVYDPVTKKTSRVLKGLDWLDLSRWTQRMARNVDSAFDLFPESGNKERSFAHGGNHCR